jgi:tetratricopeptide (TPR) repeat protein
MLYNNEGICHGKLGHYEKALEAYEKDLVIQNKTNASAEDLAISNNNIGNVLSAKGKHQEALEKYQEARRLLEKGGEHSGQNKKNVGIAISSNNIGNQYRYLKDYLKAGKWLRVALTTYKIVHPGNHPETARTLHKIGLCYSDQGDALSLASDNLQEAYDMIVQCVGYEDLKSEIMIDFACCLIARNQPEKATELLLKALDHVKNTLAKRIKYLGENSNCPTIAECYHTIGFVKNFSKSLKATFPFVSNRILDNHSDAKDWLEIALEIRQTVYLDENHQPANHPFIAQTLGELGKYYIEQNDKNSADDYLKRSIEMFKTPTGRGYRDLVSKVEKYQEEFNTKFSHE